METSASCEARYAPLLYPTNQMEAGWGGPACQGKFRRAPTRLEV